ncbi:hypothetical protein ACGF12_10855 [Kitasatospora sp. NPDC048296]|uniref:hypothetical protein n=1 Tax=Kitasatospora sp. NPDC048296 TaxID=3364048 RepID=UPI00371920AB
MSTYSDLRQETFKGIETLASAFESLTRNWKLSSEFTGDILTPLQGSNWRGDAAERAAATITKTRNELDAAFEEASAIGKTLREAHTELAAARADLDAALKRAADNSLTVDADGVNISWPAPTSDSDKHDPTYATTYKALAQSVGQDIGKAVARAKAADTAAAAALGGATGKSRTAFQPSTGPEEQGKKAADLLKLAGNLSDAQLDELNKALKANANNPQFTTAFYDRLGPDGFLKYYGQLAVASADKGNRSTAVADLQKNLGTALASATDSHNFPHLSDEWDAGLRKAGATRIEVWPAGRPTVSDQPFGYQILTNILRTGTYDPRFLNPVAEHVTQLSQRKDFWTSGHWGDREFDELKLLGSPQGSQQGGFNPMTGVLEALAHSPQAATQFFHDPPTVYNLDGSVKAHSQDKNTYLEALTKGGGESPLQDVWKGHDFPGGHAQSPGVLALGDALEAATTGRASDAPPGTPLPLHTQDMGEVMSDIVNRFGSDDGRKLLYPGGDFAALAPSLGHVSAAYMGDLQHALSKDDLLPRYGTPAKLDDSNTLKMLAALGRNPDAFGAIAQAQQAYTAAHIQEVIQHRDLYGPQFDSAVNNAAYAGGEVTGAIAAGRTHGIVGDAKAAAKAYNDAIDDNATWFKSVWTMTGGQLKYAEVNPTIAIGAGAGEEVKHLIDKAAQSYHIEAKYADPATASDFSAATTASDAAKAAVKNAAQGSGMNAQQIETMAQAASIYVGDGITKTATVFDRAAND